MPEIVFIEPQAPNLHIFSQFPLPRLGVLILGTKMKQRGWDGGRPHPGGIDGMFVLGGPGAGDHGHPCPLAAG